MDEKQVDELIETIKLGVQAGYMLRDEIIDDAVDLHLGDFEFGLLKKNSIRLTDKLLNSHLANQETWEHMTDCDRLDEAFAELDRNGIVARQNFTCCQTCGHSEISEEIKTTLKHRPARGYTFFHLQDTESAVRSGYLYLAFGLVDGIEGDSVIVAGEIMAVLRKLGLEADWNGETGTRICIKNIDWQRRRLSDLWLSALG